MPRASSIYATSQLKTPDSESCIYLFGNGFAFKRLLVRRTTTCPRRSTYSTGY